jgi:hypothetical protein
MAGSAGIGSDVCSVRGVGRERKFGFTVLGREGKEEKKKGGGAVSEPA